MQRNLGFTIFSLTLALQACGSPPKINPAGAPNPQLQLGIDTALAAQINQLFSSIFGRQPTPDELRTYGEMIASGISQIDLRQFLAGTEEARRRVEAELQNFFGTIDQQKVQLWLNALANGASLEQLIGML